MKTRLIALLAGIACAPMVLAQEAPAGDAAPAESGLAEGDGGLAGVRFLQGWDGSITLGLSGSQGNTETLNFRVDSKATKENASYDTTITLNYRYGEDDGEESENRFEAKARNDWKFEGSKWRIFVEGAYYHDTFQAWEHAATLFAGPAYAFFEEDDFKLIGRVGIGGRYEDDGPSEGFKPEALAGLNAEWKPTERQTVTGATTIYPNLDETGEYRMENEAAWEILVDPEVNLVLKVGVQHRYDSDPGEDFEKNDLDYFITLGWAF